MPDKVDAGCDRRVAEFAARRFGVLGVDELRACGLSLDAISRRTRSGRLHRLHRGVYAVGHPHVPLNGRFLAAVLACGPDAVVSHLAAAAYWGIVKWRERPIAVTVRGPGTRCHRGVEVHRIPLDRKDWMVRDGIPITSPARTVLDLMTCLTPTAARRAVREASALRLVSVRQLMDQLAKERGRPGTRRLAAIIANGPAPTRTDLEDVVLDLIDRGGYQRPDVNKPLVVGGRRLTPDFRWPGQKLIVEADGGQWHDHKLAREDDAERQAWLEAHGERVLRVTWGEAISKPEQTLARLEAAGTPRGRIQSS